MIRALFFDLDGTLLNDDKRISQANMAALSACRAQGIRLFLATARPPRLDKMLGWPPEILQLFDGGVYCNGAVLQLHGQTDCFYLPEKVACDVAALAPSFADVNFALQMPDNAHAFLHALDAFAYAPWGIEPKDVCPLFGAPFDRVLKILVFYNNLVDAKRCLPQELVQQLETVCRAQAHFWLTDGGRVVQIVSKEAGKANGVKQLCSRLHLSRSEAAVFGDDHNDLEMLSSFENSVAMGNAVPAVQSAARFVTRSNNADGVAFALCYLLDLA